ncbi:MAG: hypothetical protein AABM40_05800 [Chloroflexota bacterium]
MSGPLHERINKLLDLPADAPLEETKARIREMQAKIEAAARPSAEAVLKTLGRVKVDAAAGRLSAREALQAAALANPELVAEWRRSFRQDGSDATHLSRMTESERAAAVATRVATSR